MVKIVTDVKHGQVRARARDLSSQIAEAETIVVGHQCGYNGAFQLYNYATGSRAYGWSRGGIERNYPTVLGEVDMEAFEKFARERDELLRRVFSATKSIDEEAAAFALMEACSDSSTTAEFEAAARSVRWRAQHHVDVGMTARDCIIRLLEMKPELKRDEPT